MQTNSYSAEYGGRAGGVVNVVTRSGTNALHGSAFEFVRNYTLNARNFFASGNDGLKRNQYGAALGGPVILPKLYNGRNRTFFFGGFQFTPQRSNPNTNLTRVLTNGQGQGDYSQVVDSKGNLVIIKDPDTGLPFPGNRIPPSRLDPVFQNFLKQGVPTTTDPTGNLFYARKNISDDTQWSVRTDHQFNDNNRVFFRIYREDSTTPNLGTPGNIVSYSNSLMQLSTNASLNYMHIFRPNLVGDFGVTFNRSWGVRGQITPFTWTDLGVKLTPAASSKDFILNSVPGYFNINLFGDAILARNNFQYKGSLAWQHGKHSVKFGFDIIRRQFNIPLVNLNGGGQFSYGQLTGDGAADALIGKASSFSQSDGFRVKVRQTDWVGFVQDDLKLTRRVTLNTGLRYEPFRPWEDQWTPIPQAAYFSPGMKSKVFTDAPTGMIFYGDPGVQKPLAKQHNFRLAPRMGLAIDPFGDGKSSIRIGYGVFYDNLLPTEQVQQPANLPTFATSISFTFPASIQDPYAGRVSPFPGPYPKPSNYAIPRPLAWNAMDLAFNNPYIQQWNTTFERQVFGSANILRATYQGSKGTRLPLVYTENNGLYIPGQSTRANVNQRRPYWPDFGGFKIMKSVANSTYNAMVLTYERRFSKNWSTTTSYTWSKAIDSAVNATSANNAVINNPYNWNSNRGLSDTDRTQAFVSSYLWDLPKLKSYNPVLRAILGNWQNNGILSAYSGFTFTPGSGIDQSLTGNGADRPDVAGDWQITGDRSKKDQILKWFNTSAFILQKEGTFGTAGRNILRGPGQVNFDLGLFKQIPVIEGHNLQFRSEFFNLFNHANLGLPDANLQSPTFGRITSAGSPRIIQFGLKYAF